MSRDYREPPTEVELGLTFIQISERVWVNPQMVSSVRDDPPMAGQKEEDAGCTVYTVDEQSIYLKDEKANRVIKYLVGEAYYGV